MKKLLVIVLAASLWSQAGAQDLVIINARLVDSSGGCGEGCSIKVEDGRIASVMSGSASAPRGVRVIDAEGMTVMPGFIDAHRHIIGGDSEQWFREQSEARMQEFLDAGFTTLMSGGGPVPGILELKRRIDSGELKGPRIITSGRVDPRDVETAENARAEVRRMADAGVSIIKARMDVPGEKELTSVIVEEARKHGLEVMVHASSSPETMVAAVEAGAGKLVHTPNGGYLTDQQARMVADAGIENLSTVGFAMPTFDVYNDENVPTFRDGNAWPEGILGEVGSEAAGEKPVNARTLWDNGVTFGFGTDTGYHPSDGLKHELRGLHLMFSERDIIKLMGPNTAAFIEMGDELGTLEEGKLADLVIIEGDPRELIYNLLNVAVTIKEGRVVADHRN